MERLQAILAFAALGVDAGEVMASVQIAMMAGLPYTTLRDAMLTHPTLVEGLIPLFSGKAEKIPARQQISEVSNHLPDAAGSEISKFT